MLTGLLLASALGATPVSILVVPSTPASRTVCEELLEAFTAENVRVKLAGEKAEAITCTKKKGTERTACLVESLTKAKVDGLVLVTGNFKAGRGALSLQLLSRKGESERQEVVRGLRKRIATLSKSAINRTIATLKAVLFIEETHAIENHPAPAPEPEPANGPVAAIEQPAIDPEQGDAPTAVEVNLTPNPKPPSASQTLAAQVMPAPAKNRAGAAIVTGIAVLAAGTGGTFAGLGFMNKNKLERSSAGISELSYSQATALRDQTNLQLTVALSAGITAAVAATIAGVLWAQ